MKKRKHPIKGKGNIVFFPGINDRLREEGFTCLMNKEFNRAIDLFQQAMEIDHIHPETYMGLLTAYFEKNDYKNARGIAKEMLLRDIGDYFQIIEFYITILIQLKEYEELISTIEALLEEENNLMTSEKVLQFQQIVEFAKKMNRQKSEIQPFLKQIESELFFTGLESNDDLIVKIGQLSTQNIRPYVKEIQELLLDNTKHPFIKTMLIMALKDQEYDKPIWVEKFNHKYEIIPQNIPDIREDIKVRTICQIVEENLEQEDPVLFVNVKALIERHFFIIYPLQFESESEGVWAAAYHYIGLEFNGDNKELVQFSVKYNVSVEAISNVIAKIREYEEISSSII